MARDKLRRHIAFEAARLLFERQEAGLEQARVRAARTISGGWVHPADLPTHREIRARVKDFHEADAAAFLAESDPDPNDANRFDVYRGLLVPLQSVKQKSERHPEGDVLYHSLQVFELVFDEVQYDEELLLAALLHDVGKGIDPYDSLQAGLEALAGWVTDRTLWFIENHKAAHQLRDGTLGQRARRRLEDSPDLEELQLLARCDRLGRVPGARVRDVDAALQAVRELAAMCE
jgi:hypothetical protein